MVLSLYLSRESSNFNEIWCADANFPSKDGHVTKYQNFSNSKWRTAARLKIVFSIIYQRFIIWLTRNSVSVSVCLLSGLLKNYWNCTEWLHIIQGQIAEWRSKGQNRCVNNSVQTIDVQRVATKLKCSLFNSLNNSEYDYGRITDSFKDGQMSQGSSVSRHNEKSAQRDANTARWL